MENSKIRFILASASPRRKELLGHLKIPFEIITLNVPEESLATDPKTYALEIAKLKGEAVFHNLLKDNKDSALYVVSADTIVFQNEKIFGKPRNKEEAREYLLALSGHSHSVFTAVVVHYSYQGMQTDFSFIEETAVTFNHISPALMERYLDTGDSLDKAGAYGIQGPSLTFISKIVGDYSNVVGFPLSRFVTESEKFFSQKTHFEDLWLNLF